MRALRRAVPLGLLLLGTTLVAPARAATPNMESTKHNLSITGPGPVKATSESRICVFCHTPHNATPLSPLWNRTIPPRTYQVYTSPTLLSDPLPPPSGPTKLCLTCHDGTVAMGAVVNPSGGIAMSGGGTFPAGSLSNFGLDLRAHHPVAFPYSNALPNAELAATPPAELTFGDSDELHCTTCHDPHDNQYGRFLVKNPVNSALCITCHQMPAWAGSTHATSTALVNDVLPRPPKTWPTYATLKEWGCEACHTPHFAPTAVHLLNFTSLPPAPASCATGGCHDADPGPPHAPTGADAAERLRRNAAGSSLGADIATQLRKPSAHRESPGPLAFSRTADGAPAPGAGVACVDCHNPHELTRRDAMLPAVSGLTQGVPGIDRHGATRDRASYEYEICLRCHGDGAPDVESVPRVVSSTNARLDFAPENPSFHPVIERGRNLDLPSLPSTLEPAMRATERIACTSCHADDEGGGKGPHGSRWAPILARRYETADGTPESFDSYALCYQCHERTSILADESFRRRSAPTTGSGGGHSGHLLAGVSCAACHDAHGVAATEGDGSGSHTHLINFDRRVALPLPGASLPTFRDTGNGSGSCALVCHGVVHQDSSYP